MQLARAGGDAIGYLAELALQLWAGYPVLNLEGMLGSNWMNLLSLSNLPASPYLFLGLAHGLTQSLSADPKMSRNSQN